MDEAEAVLARIARIRELEQADAPAAELLEQLRWLVIEAATRPKSESR